MAMVKIITYVPIEAANAVRTAAGDAGAGKLGEYSHCSFSVRGTGRFIPGENAQPAVGAAGQFEAVEEEMVGVVSSREIAQTVIEAIKSAHPYEEVPIEAYPLEELS